MRLLSERPRRVKRMEKTMPVLASGVLMALSLAATAWSLSVAHPGIASAESAMPDPLTPATRPMTPQATPDFIHRLRTRRSAPMQSQGTADRRAAGGDDIIRKGGPVEGVPGGVMDGVVAGIAGGVAGGVARGVAGGIAHGVSEGAAGGTSSRVRAQAAREGQGAIDGTVFDPSGARVPGAIVSLTNTDTHKDWGAVTDDTGDFSITGLPYGKYKLEITKGGFEIYHWKDNLNADSPRSKQDVVLEPGVVTQTMVVTARGPAAAGSSPRKTGPQRIRVGGLIQALKLIEQQKPDYPEEMQARGVQGTVLMRAVISMKGEILSLRVLRSPAPELSKAALDAVTHWRYEPTLLNGEPIEVVTNVAVEFQLEH